LLAADPRRLHRRARGTPGLPQNSLRKRMTVA
jgi:hypothetical protein